MEGWASFHSEIVANAMLWCHEWMSQCLCLEQETLLVRSYRYGKDVVWVVERIGSHRNQGIHLADGVHPVSKELGMKLLPCLYTECLPTFPEEESIQQDIN